MCVNILHATLRKTCAKFDLGEANSKLNWYPVGKAQDTRLPAMLRQFGFW